MSEIMREIVREKDGIRRRKKLEEFLAQQLLEKKQEIKASKKTIEIYSDPTLTKKIEVIDFGTVEAGKSKTIRIFLKNTTSAVIENLKIEFPQVDVETFNLEIVSKPKEIPPLSSRFVELKWSPPRDFRQALKTKFIIKGEEVYRP